MKRVHQPSDVPKGHHYAVLIYRSQTVHIPGDQRSIDHPGHGYPASDETFETFEHYVTEDRNAWVAFIQKTHNPGRFTDAKPYVAFEVAGLAKVTTEVAVSVT